MPKQLEERLTLLEAEIKLLEQRIALNPNDLLAQSDLSSCIETVYLLQSPANARYLMASIKEYQSGKLVPQSIEELWQEIGIYKQISVVVEHESNHEIWSPYDAFSAEKTLTDMLQQYLKQEVE